MNKTLSVVESENRRAGGSIGALLAFVFSILRKPGEFVFRFSIGRKGVESGIRTDFYSNPRMSNGDCIVYIHTKAR